MTFKTRLSVLLLSTPMLAFVLIGGLMGDVSAGTQDDKIRNLRVFDEVISLVMSNYVEEVKVDKAMEGALRGLAEGLDPDSAYLTTAQVKEVESGKRPRFYKLIFTPPIYFLRLYFRNGLWRCGRPRRPRPKQPTLP